MATPREILNQMLAAVGGLTVSQKLIGGLIMVAAIGGFVAIIIYGNPVDFKVLYSGLSQEDAAGVVARLKEQRIPYQLTGDGTTVMVPNKDVYETRLSLAGEGLPRGGGVGFEIFDKTNLGTTDFVQRLNYQRALEGELARTIRQFQQVETARVHIATPKESIFVEDEKPPSASVSLRLRGQNKLSKGQIQSIVNLVSAAVPGLTAEHVTVVDTSGRLLFRGEGAEEGGAIAASQLEYQNRIEEVLRKKIESMLEETVGVNKALARVTALVDFSRVNVTEENFDPDTQVSRSEQLLTEANLGEGGKPQGIPGVKGNLSTTEGIPTTGANKSYERNQITRNFEISKVTRQKLEATGGITKISVAVMMDGTYENKTDKDGKVIREYKARSPEEMKRFENLVKKAIGYSEDRGDQVEVVSMPFAVSTAPEEEVSAFERWRGLMEGLAMPIAYVLVALVFVFFVVRPFMGFLTSRLVQTKRRVIAEAPSPTEEAPSQEEVVAAPKRPLTDKERILRLAQSDPDRAADLVRRWLREEYE